MRHGICGIVSQGRGMRRNTEELACLRWDLSVFAVTPPDSQELALPAGTAVCLRARARAARAAL